MPLSPIEYLKHIRDEMRFLNETRIGLLKEDFFKDAILLIHDYFGIDYQLVWNIVTEEIPKLENQISRIVSDND